MMNFEQTVKRFKQLKAQFEAGALTEDKFKAQLGELMIRDEVGSWWMIGYETEQWYRHNGTDWVQTNLPSRYSQKSTSTPKWSALSWIILAWSISWAIGSAILHAIGKDINFSIILASSGAISGALGGLVTAMILQIEDTLSDWKDVLWITLAWMIGSAIGWSSGMAISLAIGGLVVAIILKIENRLSDWISMLLITLAWIIGSTVGGEISFPIAGSTGKIIGSAVGGAIGGAIGGFVTIWQIREGKKKK